MIEFVGRILSVEPLIIEYPAGYKRELEKLAQKDSLTIKIAPPRKLRSTGERSQNHHLNGHIQQICVETGNDFAAVKAVVKQMAVSMGYPFRTFRGMVVPYSESEASVQECAILIEAVHMLAAELGINLKETEEI
ncbi:MAG: hypothetical protein BWY95_02816 [Bacteroidetes bacterium ADurb.BinA104]|nr:MAG: hypothetical protein BWY95_02816 [Bacteroidetes bacterium ADurb.BinA104]